MVEEKGKLKILLGTARRLILGLMEYCDLPDEIALSQALYVEGEYAAELVFANSKVYYVSVNSSYEIYYFIDKNSIVMISTDFIEISKQNIKKLTINEDGRNYFFRHGYYPPGMTYFNEIKRVKIGEGLQVKKNGEFDTIFFPTRKWDVTEKDYRRGIIDSVGLFSYQSDDKCLFSGGMDSSLIALILKCEYNISADLMMGTIAKLGFDEDYDQRMDYYKQFLGAKSKKIIVDYDNYTFSDIEYLVKLMPLASHAAILFVNIFKNMDNNNGRLWTGQNSDSLYSLGKTGGKLGPIMGRFLISDAYLKSVSEKNGGGNFCYWRCFCCNIF